jgi:hypothetical protein
MKNYYQTLMRQPDFRHPVGVAVVTPTPHRFIPLPGMSAEEIKQGRAQDADTVDTAERDDRGVQTE